VARGLAREARARHAAALEAYRTELDALAGDPDAQDRTHPLFASRLTLEGGVRTRRAAVEWCDWMLEQLA